MRLHWSTWLAVGLMAGVLVACQLLRYESSMMVTGEMVDIITIGLGWPCWMLETTPFKQWFPRAAAYNIIACSILIFCTGLVVERWRRNHWQLRMGSLFQLTAVIAILLGLSRLDSPALLGEAILSPFWLPWWLCLPLLIGLGCTLYAFGWAVYWLLKQVARRLRTQAG